MIAQTKKATQKLTKRHNKRLVLKTIYDQGQISRADIARATRLARTTVSSAVSELKEEGLVEKAGPQVARRGKPATLLRIDENARHVIGIELTFTEFHAAIVDLRGNVVFRLNRPSNNLRGEEALDLLYDLIEELIAAASCPLLGIGIGVPGLVDASSGYVWHALQLGWHDFPLRDLLMRRYQLPIYIANDSQVAALGAYTFGCEQDKSNLVVLTVGGGVSAGIVLNGQLYFGDSFGAGEIGHITVEKGGRTCLCGNTGCLETVVNEPVLLERAQNIMQNDPQSKLHQFISRPDAVIHLDAVLQAFKAGDKGLQQVIAEFGSHLGYAIANFTSVLNIERVLISGSLAQFGKPLLDAIETELNTCFHPILAAKTKVSFSNLEQDIVILGAIALVLSHEMGLV